MIETDAFVPQCLDNIKKMLPKLYDTQHEDVLKIEQRFEDNKGYLITNGTGTGKTLVGLGVIKRFYERGKKDILIVVPTEKKSLDWIEEGDDIGLDIYQLTDTNDKGIEIRVTTYSNFYQNEAIDRVYWDLIVYDESHYLMQNGAGKETVYLNRHKRISNLPSAAKEKAVSFMWEHPHHEEDSYYIKKEHWLSERKKIAERIFNKTKILFLSATPFAYHKSLKYGDGAIFDIEETFSDEDHSQKYNRASGFNLFLVEHLGYRMRYNKITVPESGVDLNLLERNFFETHVDKGVMSTRQLMLKEDYSRHFITFRSKLGHMINEGMELFYSAAFEDEFPILCENIHRKYNYLFISQLLETVKAQEIHERIQKHLDLGRKVVVFHSYNNSNIPHPFRFVTQDFLTAENKRLSYELKVEIMNFNDKYYKYVNLDISKLKNTRKAIKDKFPTALEYNGTVAKKKRSENIDLFNKDNSDCNILIVQSKAGREGVSMHDKTGMHQRVIINLGLPTEPTRAIQEEGRIYREGLKSNAIYEYATLQTNFERMAFAIKVAERSKTAENLAMGNLARDLETTFKEGYINSTDEDPSMEQGIGGKDTDRYIQEITPFQKSKTYYWSRGKKTARNKSSEGVDYFATPEPLGFKIVEWLNPQPNERGLEPSVGHGAIGRFFPGNTTNKFVEPSLDLASQASINCNGTVLNHSFEDLNIINKFEFIAMNPPFGIGGKVAAEHILKAVKHHLHFHNSRLIAIIPHSPQMERRLDEIMNGGDSKYFVLTKEIILPSVVFQRAGTTTQCKIIKIEHGSMVSPYHTVNRIDLSYIEDINDFFDAIESLSF